jgi:hypothetical protein
MAQYFARTRTFAAGVLLEPGQIVTLPDDVEPGDNLGPLSELPEVAVVAIAPISPTGPNPTMPQQIPTDAVQTISGYAQPGATLVGEQTAPAEQREVLAPSTGTEQSDFAELMDANGGDSSPGDGESNGEPTAAEINASLGEKTDAELTELREQEVQRERPRSTVIKAIDKELAGREG